MSSQKSLLISGILLGSSIILLGLYRSDITLADFSELKLVSGVMGTAHTLGTFLPWGNAGSLIFPTSSDEAMISASGVYLDSSNGSNITLTGNLYVETVGWGSLQSDVIVTPPGAGANVIDPWKVEGSIWTENAGYISLGSLDATSYSGVYYIPDTQSFTGYGWSENLGYIDFGLTDGIDIGFVGRVKVLGGLGGSRAYDLGGYSLGNSVKGYSATEGLSQIRKNTALLTRNLPIASKNTVTSTSPINTINNLAYYDLATYGYVTLSNPSFFTNNAIKTLVVEGGDIYISSDIAKGSDAYAIIALARDGVGGSIYIDKSVKDIHASLVADKSLYSGERVGANWELYNDTKAEIARLPSTQLYVEGSLITRNTIGGSSTRETVSGACPLTENNCDRDTAIKYDLNYFRYYDQDPARRSSKSGYDNYSFIIEHDPRIIGSPPPGLASLAR